MIMDFKITATRETAREALEAEYAEVPPEHQVDVMTSIEEVMDAVEYGSKVVFNDYLNLELRIEES
jgi:hypothetical protein